MELPSFALAANGGPGGSSPLTLVRLRIQPRPRVRMPGITCDISSHGAHRFTSVARRSSSNVNSCTGFTTWSTGSFTRRSIGPRASSVRSTSVARPPSGSLRSHGSTRASPPTSPIRSRVRSSPATVRAVMATCAPSAASRTARPVPVPPRLAPVTSATIPSQLPPMPSSSRVTSRVAATRVSHLPDQSALLLHHASEPLPGHAVPKGACSPVPSRRSPC